MKTPFLSFIVPVYNAGKYLDECLESLVNQADHNIEIILIDDGSTDDSAAICERFAAADKRVRLIRQENSGAGAARNRGLAEAKGEYVVFVDADDWIDSDLATLVEKGRGSDIIYFGYIEHIDSKEIACPIPRSGDHSGDIDKTLVELFHSPERFFGFTWNKAFRREIIAVHGISFDPRLIIKEDEDFCVRFVNHISSLYVSGAVPYHYRILSDSLSHRRQGERRLSLLAERIEADAQRCPWPALKGALFDAAYEYHLDGFRDSEGESFGQWDAFVQRRRSNLGTSNSMIGFFRLPGSWLRRQVLKLIYINSAVNFLRTFKRKISR